MILRDPTKFQKVTRGGKTIFIPVPAKSSAATAVIKSSANISSVPVVRTPVFNTNRSPLTNTKRTSNINTLKVARIAPPSKNLNLGSLFVQSAEQGVTGVHQVANSSRSIFVQSNNSNRCYNTRAARVSTFIVDVTCYIYINKSCFE